ncbi:MAG: twin-arginine translocation signal domain-containing protein [Alphaproteobacteria bacterium]
MNRRGFLGGLLAGGVVAAMPALPFGSPAVVEDDIAAWFRAQVTAALDGARREFARVAAESLRFIADIVAADAATIEPNVAPAWPASPLDGQPRDQTPTCAAGPLAGRRRLSPVVAVEHSARVPIAATTPRPGLIPAPGPESWPAERWRARLGDRVRGGLGGLLGAKREGLSVPHRSGNLSEGNSNVVSEGGANKWLPPIRSKVCGRHGDR